MYAVIKEKMNDRFRQIWQLKNQKLKEIMDDVDSYKARSRFMWREQVVINRLKLGHSHLIHEYLMDNTVPDIPPIWTRCQNAQMTVKHVLLNCTALNARELDMYLYAGSEVPQ